jgi:hypothetical protein
MELFEQVLRCLRDGVDKAYKLSLDLIGLLLQIIRVGIEYR